MVVTKKPNKFIIWTKFFIIIVNSCEKSVVVRQIITTFVYFKSLFGNVSDGVANTLFSYKPRLPFIPPSIKFTLYTPIATHSR